MEEEKRSYHHGSLRSTLIEGGVKVLAREGLAGLSLRKVAKEAGVSHAAPYRHFQDKESLLAAIALDGLKALSEGMLKAYEQHKGDPEAMLVAACVTYVKLALAQPDTVRLMFGGTLRMERVAEEAQKTAEERENACAPYAAYEGLLRVVSAAQAAGMYPGAGEQEVALMLWSFVHGFAMLLIGNQLENPPQTEEQLESLGRRISELMLKGMHANFSK